MTPAPEKHQRRSIRLKSYDYAQTGAYFVTVCTWNRECLLGEVFNGKIRLNEYGSIVEQVWLQTNLVRTDVKLNEFWEPLIIPHRSLPRRGCVTIVICHCERPQGARQSVRF